MTTITKILRKGSKSQFEKKHQFCQRYIASRQNSKRKTTLVGHFQNRHRTHRTANRQSYIYLKKIRKSIPILEKSSEKPV